LEEWKKCYENFSKTDEKILSSDVLDVMISACSSMDKKKKRGRKEKEKGEVPISLSDFLESIRNQANSNSKKRICSVYFHPWE
jgi:hypothetical protein